MGRVHQIPITSRFVRYDVLHKYFTWETWCLGVVALGISVAMLLGVQTMVTRPPPPYLYVFTSQGTWCEPCIEARPLLEQIEQNGLLVRRVYVDTSQGRSTAEKYGVKQVPTMFLVVGDRIVGEVQLTKPKT